LGKKEIKEGAEYSVVSKKSSLAFCKVTLKSGRGGKPPTKSNIEKSKDNQTERVNSGGENLTGSQGRFSPPQGKREIGVRKKNREHNKT